MAAAAGVTATPCYSLSAMATPEEKRPSTLEEAVQELGRDREHPVRVRVGDLEVELRVVGPAETPVSGIEASAGGWATAVDCEAFEREVYQRRHRPRPLTGL